MKYFYLLGFISLSILSSKTRGEPQSLTLTSEEKIEKLLEMKHRPSIPEILSYFPNPEEPIPTIEGKENKNSLEKFTYYGAEMITQLEYAYPNAIWGPLGRDAIPIGEALEAYYHAAGIKKRVYPLNLSTQSFENSSATVIYQFVKDNVPVFNQDGFMQKLVDPMHPVRSFVVLDLSLIHI